MTAHAVRRYVRAHRSATLRRVPSADASWVCGRPPPTPEGSRLSWLLGSGNMTTPSGRRGTHSPTEHISPADSIFRDDEDPPIVARPLAEISVTTLRSPDRRCTGLEQSRHLVGAEPSEAAVAAATARVPRHQRTARSQRERVTRAYLLLGLHPVAPARVGNAAALGLRCGRRPLHLADYLREGLAPPSLAHALSVQRPALLLGRGPAVSLGCTDMLRNADAEPGSLTAVP